MRCVGRCPRIRRRPAGDDGPTFLRAWLDGQHAPFVPAIMRMEDGGLLVGYRRQTPPGLLPG